MKKSELRQIIREEIKKVMNEAVLPTTTWPDDIKQWPSEIKATTTTGRSVNLKKTLRKFQYVLDNNKWRRPKYGERGAEKISLPAYETKQGSIVNFYNIDFATKKLNSPI